MTGVEVERLRQGSAPLPNLPDLSCLHAIRRTPVEIIFSRK